MTEFAVQPSYTMDIVLWIFGALWIWSTLESRKGDFLKIYVN